jgi:hypothetical protein
MLRLHFICITPFPGRANDRGAFNTTRFSKNDCALFSPDICVAQQAIDHSAQSNKHNPWQFYSRDRSSTNIVQQFVLLVDRVQLVYTSRTKYVNILEYIFLDRCVGQDTASEQRARTARSLSLILFQNDNATISHRLTVHWI